MRRPPQKLAGLVVADAFHPSTQEAEAGGSLGSRPAWSTEQGQDSQGYTEKPCLEKKLNKIKNAHNENVTLSGDVRMEPETTRVHLR